MFVCLTWVMIVACDLFEFDLHVLQNVRPPGQTVWVTEELLLSEPWEYKSDVMFTIIRWWGKIRKNPWGTPRVYCACFDCAGRTHAQLWTAVALRHQLITSGTFPHQKKNTIERPSPISISFIHTTEPQFKSNSFKTLANTQLWFIISSACRNEGSSETQSPRPCILHPHCKLPSCREAFACNL